MRFSGAVILATKKPQKTVGMKMFLSHHPAASCAAAAVAIVLGSFCTVLVSGTHLYGHQTSLESLVGTVCTPPFGFLPLTCGDYEVIESSSELAPIYKYG